MVIDQVDQDQAVHLPLVSASLYWCSTNALSDLVMELGLGPALEELDRAPAAYFAVVGGAMEAFFATMFWDPGAPSPSPAPSPDPAPELVTLGQKTVPQAESVQGHLALDWLAVTYTPRDTPREDDALAVLEIQRQGMEAMGYEQPWIDMGYGRWGYRKGMRGPGGSELYWDAPGRRDIHLSMPGEACALMGEDRARKYLRYAVTNGSVTRCDLAFDDTHHIASPDDVRATLKRSIVTEEDGVRTVQKEAVTHARVGLRIDAFTVGEAEDTGSTVYLGSNTSRIKLRVYNKSLESAGETDGIRWELQCRKEPAQTLAADLADQRWGEVYASHLVAFVDFRDPHSHSEVEKRHRLPWFRQLVGFARKAKVYWPKAPRRLVELEDWVERCIAPSLLVVAKVFDDDKPVLLPFLGRLGRMLMDVEPNRRWKPRHEDMVSRFRAERGPATPFVRPTLLPVLPVLAGVG